MLLDVLTTKTPRAGLLRDAAFYVGGTAKFSDAGRDKLRAMVSAIPEGATDVAVTVVGVSTAMGTPEENLELARDRAQRIVDYLKDAGVTGTYTVSVSTTFDVRAGDKALDSVAMDQPLESSAGKPLTSVAISFTEPGP